MNQLEGRLHVMRGSRAVAPDGMCTRHMLEGINLALEPAHQMVWVCDTQRGGSGVDLVLEPSLRMAMGMRMPHLE